MSVAELGAVYVPAVSVPSADVLVPPAEVTLPARQIYAGFWLRGVAFFLDSFLMSAIFVLADMLAPSRLVLFPEPDASLRMAIPQLTPAGFLVLFLGMWIYYAAFETSSWQATPGKRVMRLYVTDLNGHPLTFRRASVRYLGRKISELIFLVGYLMAGFTEKKQGLHDLIAGCLVLRRPSTETLNRPGS